MTLMVIIASDNPAPPVGDMRAMMKRNALRGVTYLFYVPQDATPIVEAYQLLQDEINEQNGWRDPAIGCIELHKYKLDKDLRHIIFYHINDGTSGGGPRRIEALIRLGDVLSSPYLLVQNHEVATALYTLFRNDTTGKVNLNKDISLPLPLRLVSSRQ